LQAIGTQWNVSLFHYRIMDPTTAACLPASKSRRECHGLFAAINELQYAYTEETDNPATGYLLGT